MTVHKKCPYCGGLIAIRNPTGKCDHLYYPEYVNKSLKEEKSSSITPDEFEKWVTELKSVLPKDAKCTDSALEAVIAKYHQVRADKDSELVKELRELCKVERCVLSDEHGEVGLAKQMGIADGQRKIKTLVLEIISKHGGK